MMNLISFTLSLRRPVRRDEALRWQLSRQPYARVGGMILGDVRAELHSGPSGSEREQREPLGEAHVKAQVVDPATYQAQRRTP
jgi:hypothetical protein